MEIFMGYDFTGGRIFDFPIDFSMGFTTVQRYCAACDIQVRVYFTFTLHSPHPNPGNKMIWRARHFSKETYFNRLRHISLIICLCFFMSVSFLMSFLPCAVFYVFLPFWRIPSITDRLLDCLHKFTWLFFLGGDFSVLVPPLPPVGHIWDVMLVWRKENINKICLCVTVLCTIIMVHKDTSSSYGSVDCIGLWSCLV